MKSDLRKKIRTLKHTFSAEQLSSFSENVCSRLLSDADIIKANVILAYMPLPDEVDIQPLIESLSAANKRILLPEVVSDNEIVLREHHSKSDLKRGAFGILEPTGKIFTDYSLLDVILVPGMAFDSKGNRLGRGKGYYDRFLAKVQAESATLPHLIGVCFPFQIVEEVPTNEFDHPVDRLA